jgi:hypothetical protein
MGQATAAAMAAFGSAFHPPMNRAPPTSAVEALRMAGNVTSPSGPAWDWLTRSAHSLYPRMTSPEFAGKRKRKWIHQSVGYFSKRPLDSNDRKVEKVSTAIISYLFWFRICSVSTYVFKMFRFASYHTYTYSTVYIQAEHHVLVYPKFPTATWP